MAGVRAAKARLETNRKAVEAALASAEQIKIRIDDCFLKAPVSGRVLYRLAEEGEVLAAGGKVLTLLDLSHVLTLTGGTHYNSRLKIEALSGGQVNLSQATQITDPDSGDDIR